jgi:hypothetical protein
MRNIDKVIDAFVTGDYFIIFLILTLAILLVLVLALVKSRGEYNELLRLELEKNKKHKDDNSIISVDEDDILSELDDLRASTKDDIVDINKPLIKQIDISNLKTYDDIINDYESSEEENAVISREELEQKAQERRDALGDSENQIAIAAYEEEQEKKAIISYEQLLKNASNITLTYKEENREEKDAPKINKVEVEQKEVSAPELYLEQEEFLKILKEFRVSLNENIFN